VVCLNESEHNRKVKINLINNRPFLKLICRLPYPYSPSIMKPIKLLNTFLFTAFAALAICGLTTFSLQAEPLATTNAAPAKLDATDVAKPLAKKQLTGAELYSIHCNRCHPERYPTERTAAQWKTIMLHMQVRASIPGKQARLILQYLQENSGR